MTDPEVENAEDRVDTTADELFLIVGIGASAGGLETFERLFTNMPPDSGMAFVIVQHLGPTHESIPCKSTNTLYENGCSTG